MLRALVSGSLRFRGIVVALACVAIAYGVYVSYHARFDVFPEFAPPQVTIQTEAPGLSPEQVESLVTTPVESAVNGVGGLSRLTSQSIQGLSIVTVTFQEGTDVLRARQLVGESLVEAKENMPEGVKEPRMAPLSSSTSTVLSVGLTSKTRTPMELRTFADWTMRPRLLGVKGVAKVTIFGGEVRQLQVQVKPERLAALRVSLDEVMQAAKQATAVLGAGFIETSAQRIVLQTEGQSLTAAELGECMVRGGGAPEGGGATIRLKDVADVVEGGQPKFGDASVQGKPGVVLVVGGQYGSNTTEVTEATEAVLAEMEPQIKAEGIDLHKALFRPANFVSTAIGNVRHSLLLGGALVAVVLFLFLFNVRTAFISITAIPLSLLVAVVVLGRMGLTINTLTLGGLAIAIGEVVDDAIIDVENIFRRLRQRAEGVSIFRVVLDASIEVRGAVIYATLVVALVFLPVLTMSGIQGKLFMPLGAAYVLAILASLLVALTLTPALSLLLLPRVASVAKEPPLAKMLAGRYRRWLTGAMARPKTLVASVVGLCLAAGAAIPWFGGAFLPDLQEGSFILHMSAAPGTSLSETMRIGDKVTEELLKNPKVRSIAATAGRAEMGDDFLGPFACEFWVDLVPLQGDEGEEVQDQIRNAVAKFTGLGFSITPFLTERIEETVSGATAAVVVKVAGSDADAMDRTAAKVAEMLKHVPGAADLHVDPPPAQLPLEVVKLRPDRLRQFGMKPVEVLDAVETCYQGTPVAKAYDRNRMTDVVVMLADSARRAPETVQGLLLRDAGQRLVPLREVAEVYPTTGRYMVSHEGGRRLVTVTCNVAGRDLSSFVADAKKAVGKVEVPQGVLAPRFTGAEEAHAEATKEIVMNSILAGIGILLLLSIVYGNPRNLLLVLSNLPFALVGGVIAVFCTGGWLSVGSMVGFVTLFGITTRNSIMLISHYEHLVREEGMTWGVETAVQGAMERLAPILMTALVTGLGLLPIAIGSGDPGREIEGPMAIVILGGLLTSTALNLLVLPTLALKYGRFDRAPVAEPV